MNDLVSIDMSGLPSTQLGSSDDFEKSTANSGFLQRLQLYSKGKAIDKGLVKPGHWGIPKSVDSVTDLSDSIDLICFARRLKAIDMSDRDAIITIYQTGNPEYSRIVESSGEPDSGCSHGPSFLVWERETELFLELFMGTKSSRPEAKFVFPYLPLTQARIDELKAEGHDTNNLEPHFAEPFTLKSRLVEKGSWSWFVPVVHDCSVPFETVPEKNDIITQMTKFLSVSDTAVTKRDANRAR